LTEQDDTGTTLPLAEGFAPATAEQWWDLVGAVLRKSGGLDEAPDPATALDLLSTTTYDGVRIRPLYTADDRVPDSGFPGVAPYVRGSRPTGLGRQGWDVRQHFSDPDPAVTRQAVLTDLENGVTSLWLEVGASGIRAGDLPEVLADVLLDLAPVVLDAGADTPDAAARLMAVWRDRLADPAVATGSLGLDPLAVQARTGASADLSAVEALVSQALADHPRVRAMAVDALPYHGAGGSDAQELGCALAAGVAYLRALEERGFSPEVACGQLEFRYAATADQFLTIAKLRAARRLWSRVTELSGVPAADRGQVQHAVTSEPMMTRRDPWVNMLRTTLACFGAATGGAQAVTVLPFDAAIGLPTTFSRRIARNTHALLAEESNIARVADPAGGSWYVETLTEDLARTAWEWFRRIEREGGLGAALRSGLVADELAATAATRKERVAHRADPVTGVSEFPLHGEKPLQRKPFPVSFPVSSTSPSAPGGLPRLRRATAFEALADRAASFARATGSPPRVFLANIGPLRSHAARAGFAANLFWAGGIEVERGEGGSPEEVVAAFRASGATAACLCGSDRQYAEQGAEVAAALTAAGATWLALAGAPGDRESSYRQAGVETFLFTGCDAVDVLGRTLDGLGVPA
jgi:methylmalonyl-CoA mutase